MLVDFVRWNEKVVCALFSNSKKEKDERKAKVKQKWAP